MMTTELDNFVDVNVYSNTTNTNTIIGMDMDMDTDTDMNTPSWRCRPDNGSSDYDTVAQRLLERHAAMQTFLHRRFGAERVQTVVPGVYKYPLLSHEEGIQGYENLMKECRFQQLSASQSEAVLLPRLEAFQAAVAEPRAASSSLRQGVCTIVSAIMVLWAFETHQTLWVLGLLTIAMSIGLVAARRRSQVVLRRWYAWDPSNIHVPADEPTATPRAAASRLVALFGAEHLNLGRLHVVINSYLKPSHLIGPHQDKMLSSDPLRPPDIHTVTYGPDKSAWRFRVRDVFRHVLIGNGAGLVVLQPGDAMLMLFEANLLYFHEVVGPVSKVEGEFAPRISVTLREMLASYDAAASVWTDASGRRMDRQQTLEWLEAARSNHFARSNQLRDSCRQLAHA